MTTPATIDTDIAIIGGGMVGITAALLLAARLPGARIQLLERFALHAAAPYQPSFDQRATAIAAGSFEALAALDLQTALAPVSGAIRQVQVSDRGHWGHATIHASEQGLPALGWVVPNAALGQQLLQRLTDTPAIHTAAPVVVQQLRAVSGGYQLITDSGEMRARLVIMADGADAGSLKSQLGIAQSRTDYQQTAVIANVATSLPHQGRAFERFTDWGPMALLPLAAPDQCALVWTLNAEQRGLADASDADFLAQLQQRFGDRLGHFTRVGVRDCYSLALVEAREQVRSHLVLLGNAAHFLHPVAGQGFNLSVRDIAALANVLADAHSRGEALGTLDQLSRYQQLRARDQWLTTQYSHQLVHWFSSADWLQILPRQLGLMALQALPGVKHWLAQQSLGHTLVNQPTGRRL